MSWERRRRALTELVIVHGLANLVVIGVVWSVALLARLTSTSFAQGTMFMSNVVVLFGFMFVAPAVTGRVLGDRTLRSSDLGSALPLGGRTILMPYVILLSFLVIMGANGGHYLWSAYAGVRDLDVREFDSTAELVDHVAGNGGVEGALRGAIVHLPGAVRIAEYGGASSGRWIRGMGGPSNTSHWVWPLFTRTEIADDRARVPAHVWQGEVGARFGEPETLESEWFVPLLGQSVEDFTRAVVNAQGSEPAVEPTIILFPIASPEGELERRSRHLRLAFTWGNLGPLIAFFLFVAIRRFNT